jgi:hypothetical protein
MFAKFIREKRFISNLSERTIKSYEGYVFGGWKRFVGPQTPNEENLTAFVIGMREAELAVTTCNITIRTEHGDIPR